MMKESADTERMGNLRIINVYNLGIPIESCIISNYMSKMFIFDS